MGDQEDHAETDTADRQWDAFSDSGSRPLFQQRIERTDEIL